MPLALAQSANPSKCGNITYSQFTDIPPYIHISSNILDSTHEGNNTHTWPYTLLDTSGTFVWGNCLGLVSLFCTTQNVGGTWHEHWSFHIFAGVVFRIYLWASRLWKPVNTLCRLLLNIYFKSNLRDIRIYIKHSGGYLYFMAMRLEILEMYCWFGGLWPLVLRKEITEDNVQYVVLRFTFHPGNYNVWPRLTLLWTDLD